VKNPSGNLAPVALSHLDVSRGRPICASMKLPVIEERRPVRLDVLDAVRRSRLGLTYLTSRRGEVIGVVPSASTSPELAFVTALAADGNTVEIDLTRPDAAPVREALSAYVASVQTGATGRASAGETWVREVGERLDDGLHRLLRDDPSIADTDPATLADHLVAAVPTRHDLDVLTGPFYDTSGLTKWLGITRQALDARANKGSLLMCPLADGTRVYPAWQFRTDKTTVPHLAEAVRILRAGAKSPWTVATWLRTPLREFDDNDAVTWLDRGHDPDRVLRAASEDATRWAH